MNRKYIKKSLQITLASVIGIQSCFVQCSFADNINNVFSNLPIFLNNYEVDESALFLEIPKEEKIVKNKTENKYNNSNVNKSKVENISNKKAEDLDITSKKAFELLGKKYKFGAYGSEEFDCSGLIYYIYSTLGKKIPRTSSEQYKFGVNVEKIDLKPGDIVFFDTRNSKDRNNIKIDKSDTLLDDISIDNVSKLDIKVTHCGIYVGDGKFIHASSGTVMKVVVEELDSKYFAQRYVGAKRYL